MIMMIDIIKNKWKNDIMNEWMNDRRLAPWMHGKIELKTVTDLSTIIRPTEPVAGNKQTNELNTVVCGHSR